MSLELAKETSQAAQPNTLPGALVQNHPDAGVQIPSAAGKPRPTPTLSPNGLSVAEYKRRQWFCEVPEGVTIEDVQKPEFWAHVAAKMTPFDRVEVVAVDGTWAAELMVLATGRTAAKVKVIHIYDFDGGYSDMSQVNNSHKVLHRGPRKWSIIRLSDNQIIKEGIASREEAEQQMADYIKALGI